MSASVMGASSGIDYERVRVDGGGAGDPMTEQVLDAAARLASLEHVLGKVGYFMMVSVVGEGRPIGEVAQSWSKRGGKLAGTRAAGYVTGRVIEGLDELVRLWGLEAEGKERREQIARDVGRGRRVNVGRGASSLEQSGNITVERDVAPVAGAAEWVPNHLGDLVPKRG